MQIHHATTEDVRAVAEIHVDTWRAAYAEIIPADFLAALSVAQRETMWHQCITSRSPELLVAKQAGTVQGWLSFGLCRDKSGTEAEGEVWALYVAPTSWSTGVGRQLWLRAKELMLSQGFTACSLWVFPQNERAIKFYHAAGFSHDGSAPRSFTLGGVQLQEIRLVCQL